MVASTELRRERWLLVPILIVAGAFLASGCLWGFATDADSGAAIPGATVRYTDTEGRGDSTTTNTIGLYAFDIARGPIPALGTATFEVSGPGYEPLTEAHLIAYDDNPHATLDNPSSFWEIQDFDLVPVEPSGSVRIVDYTPFDRRMLPDDRVSVTVEYTTAGPVEFILTFGYEVKAAKGTWWCDTSYVGVPAPASGTLFLGCSLGPMPDWAPGPEYPYPHEHGVVEILLRYETAPGTHESVAGEFVVDEQICPSEDTWPWPVCP